MVTIFDSQLITVEFIVFGVVTHCQTLIVRVNSYRLAFLLSICLILFSSSSISRDGKSNAIIFISSFIGAV